MVLGHLMGIFACFAFLVWYDDRVSEGSCFFCNHAVSEQGDRDEN